MRMRNSKQGQAMVEYIVIVVLIAIAGIALWSLFGSAIAKKVSGATSALDDEIGQEAQDAYQDVSDGAEDGGTLRRLDETGGGLN